MKINNFDEEKAELLREIAFVKREIYELEKEEDFKEARIDRKSTRLNSSHWNKSRMPSSA